LIILAQTYRRIFHTRRSPGLGAGFGSNFGVWITELVDGLVNVIFLYSEDRKDITGIGIPTYGLI
jgi:hypothetical protein